MNLFNVFLELVQLFLIDALFIGLLIAVILVPLALAKKAAFAVLKRNFVGYFSNPTGYVFLCLFVVLTSLGAFFPHEFFSSNLANLDQLNKWIPLIMLLFIPAITMSIWADERRQGTDELLLTLPAGDFDIVVGKYLAAAAIFTVSLLFSQISSYAVLVALTLGDVDSGLLFTTYLGYWFMGLAMLSTGMVASFLTSNLTVGFILGVLLNAPLVLSRWADVFVARGGLQSSISHWSLAAKFDDFGRGVVSLASAAYFIMIVVLGIYLSIVLIGSRHWFGGRDGQSMLGHYVLRALALVGIIMGITVVLSNYDYARLDMTRNKVSSLSPKTRQIIESLDNKYPIIVDAYIGANMPERYARTEYDLRTLLKEFSAMAGKGIQVNIHDNLERASEEAQNANTLYKIVPKTVTLMSRGAIREEQLILGVGMRCGTEEVSVPFLDYGLPVEYELVRSIATVAKAEKKHRKKLGVVSTDAQVMGGFTMAGMMPQQIPPQSIIAELQKQYSVESVDLTEPLTSGKYDVLLVVQPSSLGPQQMGNLVSAVKQGVPCAIFEDPLPAFMSQAPGTADPKRGGGFQQQPQPKGDIRLLWKALGISILGDGKSAGPVSVDLVWQRYNPYKKLALQGIGPELVFVRNDFEQPTSGVGKKGFEPSQPVVESLEEVLFPFPGAVLRDDTVDGIEFTELVRTGDSAAGFVNVKDWIDTRSDQEQQAQKMGDPTGKAYVIAARVTGKAPEKKDDPKKDDAKKDDEKKDDENSKGIRAIYVSDIDCLHSQFVDMRARPENELFGDVTFNFDNVSFVLNVIDDLADDDRFLTIRSRKFKHSTLRAVERETESAREKMEGQVASFRKEYKKSLEDADKKIEESLKELRSELEGMQKKRDKGEPVDYTAFSALVQQVEVQQKIESERAAKIKERLQKDLQSNVTAIELSNELEIQRIQNWFKYWAIALPPIPPLLLGLIVFARRRLMEREGISKTRMK